jgi:hypothetical protein
MPPYFKCIHSKNWTQRVVYNSIWWTRVQVKLCFDTVIRSDIRSKLKDHFWKLHSTMLYYRNEICQNAVIWNENYQKRKKVQSNASFSFPVRLLLLRSHQGWSVWRNVRGGPFFYFDVVLIGNGQRWKNINTSDWEVPPTPPFPRQSYRNNDFFGSFPLDVRTKSRRKNKMSKK